MSLSAMLMGSQSFSKALLTECFVRFGRTLRSFPSSSHSHPARARLEPLAGLFRCELLDQGLVRLGGTLSYHLRKVRFSPCYYK